MRSFLSFASFSVLWLLAPSCSQAPAAEDPGKPPVKQVLHSRTGLASYYGTLLHGEETASGEILDKTELIAAHPTYPFGTIVRVTNLENNRSVELRIIDRGPAKQHQSDGVIIDVSQRAARDLGFIKDGRTRVRVDVLEWGPEVSDPSYAE